MTSQIKSASPIDEVDGFENWWSEVQEISNLVGSVDLTGVRPDDVRCKYYDVFQAYVEVTSPEQFVQEIQPDNTPLDWGS